MGLMLTHTAMKTDQGGSSSQPELHDSTLEECSFVGEVFI